MLFVCLEIAGGKMVVMLRIAHDSSSNGNSLYKGKRFLPRKRLGGGAFITRTGLSLYAPAMG